MELYDFTKSFTVIRMFIETLPKEVLQVYATGFTILAVIIVFLVIKGFLGK